MDILEFPVPAGIDDAAPARIVYASRAAFDGPPYAEMERIRASALRHNPPLGIHTALLHQGGWFLQWKEGPPPALREVMERVARDGRHRELSVVHASRGPRLLHGPWSMAIVARPEPPEAVAARIGRVRQALEGGRQHTPAEVWRRISMPIRTRAGEGGGDPESYQRVLFCSAVGTTAFELVRWLARGGRAELEQRRFAGLQADVATDSADLQVDGRPVRVVAMARRGLALPLTRALLPGYGLLVLLLCGEAERDELMLRRLAEACAAIEAPPSLVGVGCDPQQHARLFALAHRLKMVYLDALADPRDYANAWAALKPFLSVWREPAHAGAPVGLPRLLRG